MSELLDELDAFISNNQIELDNWFAKNWQASTPPFYSSVDLRHSGFKLVPVDTNLFPAGFNNLSDTGKLAASQNMREFFVQYYPEIRSVLIIPESHTRNRGYIDNLYTLVQLLQAAGMQVEVGRIPLGDEPASLLLEGSNADIKVQTYGMKRENDRVITDTGFQGDIILLNNDLTSGVPDILCDITQKMLPSPCLGWFRRRKSVHFEAYATLLEDFCTQFSLDKWKIFAWFHQCGSVDFHAQQGISCVAKGVEKILAQTQAEYAAHAVPDAPYVFIKADSGTYGMGIMTAHSPDEVLQMNKKTRNKMHVIKEGTQSTEVIIQEGVLTIDKCEQNPAEPVVYLVGGKAIGGAWRVNAGRDSQINLNATGMFFVPMENVRPAHALVAQLASLAAAREVYVKPCC